MSGFIFGDPLEVGCAIAFMTCQNGSSSMVPLYRIDFTPMSSLSNWVLQVERSHQEPKDVMVCPALILCDAPVFTAQCVQGGSAVLNGTSEPCTTPTSPITWSRFLELYR